MADPMTLTATQVVTCSRCGQPVELPRYSTGGAVAACLRHAMEAHPELVTRTSTEDGR